VSLLKTYGRSHNTNKVNQTFEDMKRKIDPTINSYESLMKILLNCKAFGECEKIFQEVQKKRLPDHTIITLLLNAYHENKQYEKVISLYEDHIIFSPRLDISQNLENFNIVLSCSNQLKRIDLIEELYLLIMRNINNRFQKIDDLTFINLINYTATTKEKTEELYDYLICRREEMSDELINYFMESFKSQNNHEYSEKVHMTLINKGTILSLQSYEFLSGIYEKNANNSYILFDEMIKNEIIPTLQIYNSIIKSQINFEYIDRAISIFKNLLTCKVSADFMLFDLIIKSCLKFRRVKEGSEFAYQAVKNNVLLDEAVQYKIIDDIIADENMKPFEKVESMTTFTEELKKKNFYLKQTMREKVERFIYIQSNGGGSIYHSTSIYSQGTEQWQKHTQKNNYQAQRNNYSVQNNHNLYNNRQINKPTFSRNECSLYSAKIY
jgi:hypothetical protein